MAGFGSSAAVTADAAVRERPVAFVELFNLDVDSELLLNLYFSLQWFTLDEVCKGKLHLKLEWLTLMPDPSTLDKVLTDIRADKGQANDGLSSSLLILYLDSARNLPVGLTVGLGCSFPHCVTCSVAVSSLQPDCSSGEGRCHFVVLLTDHSGYSESSSL